MCWCSWNSSGTAGGMHLHARSVFIGRLHIHFLMSMHASAAPDTAAVKYDMIPLLQLHLPKHAHAGLALGLTRVVWR